MDLRGKNVILVGDIVDNADTLLAPLQTIRNQKPAKIYVGAVVASPEAFAELSARADEVVFLHIADNIHLRTIYEEQSVVEDEEVKHLVLQAMNDRTNGKLC